MSSMLGILERMHQSGVRRQAAIIGNAAFFAPPIWTVPRRGCLPSIRRRTGRAGRLLSASLGWTIMSPASGGGDAAQPLAAPLSGSGQFVQPESELEFRP